MQAMPEAAMLLDKAQRQGVIYMAELSWRCTTTGRNLERDGNYLFCPHCGLTVVSPNIRSPTP